MNAHTDYETIKSLLLSTEWLLKCCIVYGGERALAVVVLPLCVPVCLSTLILNIVYLSYNVGTIEQQSKQNFATWLNAIFHSISSKVQVSVDSTGEEVEGCYEGLSCSDLQKITAKFENLDGWKAACSAKNCCAGRFLAITGNESNMTITRHRYGPFCWTSELLPTKTNEYNYVHIHCIYLYALIYIRSWF